MRIPLLFALVTLTLTLCVDAYIFFAAKRRLASKTPLKIQVYSALALYALLLVGIFMPMRSGDSGILLAKMWILFSYMTFFVGKAVFVIIDILGRIPAIFGFRPIPFAGLAGGVFGLIGFLSMWWGALVNRLSVDTVEIDVPVENLPDSFDGYRIVQISDLHVGTFGEDTDFVERMVQHVNALNPDLIVFTGDIVNRKTSEIEPFIESLSRLSALDGVYSILGNHDYGDYYEWNSEEEKAASLKQLIDIQKSMGWNLLLNEHRYIHHGGDSIAIIGVENIGDPPFAVYGDLAVSYPDLADSTMKILLTHNPAHWKMEVADREHANIPLTLSGHTHAMQIRLFGWSPAAWRYADWGGLYRDKSGRHAMYINIGAGTVGLPMRLGATPEVTVLTLERAESGINK